jgi:hypothetical protein
MCTTWETKLFIHEIWKVFEAVLFLIGGNNWTWTAIAVARLLSFRLHPLASHKENEWEVHKKTEFSGKSAEKLKDLL